MSGSNSTYWFAQSLYTQGFNYSNPYAGSPLRRAVSQADRKQKKQQV